MSGKNGDKKEDAKPLPVAGQQVSQTGSDDQMVSSSSSNPISSSQQHFPVGEAKQRSSSSSSSTQPLNADSSSKLEAKGSEGREVKKQSHAESPPKTDRFSGVFSGTKQGLSQELGKFLDEKSFRNLSQVNKNAHSVSAYERLKRDIGPHPERLLLPSETPRAAYGRHSEIISKLGPIEDMKELAAHIKDYPHYHFKRRLTPTKLSNLFYSSKSDLEAAGEVGSLNQVRERLLADEWCFTSLIRDSRDLVVLTERFPGFDYANRAVEKVLADDKHFTRVIRGWKDLVRLGEEFPDSDYAKHAVEKVLVDDKHFTRLIRGLDDIMMLGVEFPSFDYELAFGEMFPDYDDQIKDLLKAMFPGSDYAKQAVEKVLTDDKHFTHVIKGLDELQILKDCFPDYEKQAFGKVLTDDKHFTRVIEGRYDLEGFMKTFRDYASKAAEKVLTNDVHFTRIITKLEDTYLLEGFAINVFEKVLVDKHFTRLIRCLDNLVDLGFLPAFKKVLSDDVHFTRLIKSVSDLSFFASFFPDDADNAVEKVFSKVLADDKHFAHLTTRFGDLADFRRFFPDYADKVVEKVLSDYKHFTRIIKSPGGVVGTGGVKETVEKMLVDDKHFTCAIRELGDLVGFKEMFPDYANTAVEKVLADDAHFTRLVRGWSDFDTFRKHFSDCGYAERAKKLFYVKQERSVSPELAKPSFFASNPCFTTDSPQDDCLVPEQEFSTTDSPRDDCLVPEQEFRWNSRIAREAARDHWSLGEFYFSDYEKEASHHSPPLSEAKSVAPLTERGRSSFFSSSSSSSSATTGFTHDSSPVREAKEQEMERSEGSNLPAGGGAGASTQSSSHSSDVDLPRGDNGEEEGLDHSSPSSSRGSS